MRKQQVEFISSLLLFLFLSSHVVSSSVSRKNLVTPKEYAACYWDHHINNVPRPEFFLNKASPLSALDSARFTQLAAQNSLSTDLNSFCRLADLYCLLENSKGHRENLDSKLGGVFQGYSQGKYQKNKNSEDHKENLDSKLGGAFQGYSQGKYQKSKNSEGLMENLDSKLGGAFQGYSQGQYQKSKNSEGHMENLDSKLGGVFQGYSQGPTQRNKNSEGRTENLDSKLGGVFQGYSQGPPQRSKNSEGRTENLDSKLGGVFQGYSQGPPQRSKNSEGHMENLDSKLRGAFQGYSQGKYQKSKNSEGHLENLGSKLRSAFQGYSQGKYQRSSMEFNIESGTFFREKMLKEGTVMPMPDIEDKLPQRSFLPRSIVSNVPFNSSNISQLKHIFHAADNSTMETILNFTLHECERAPSPGETKKCVGSIEDMIDFVVSNLGRSSEPRFTQNINGSKKDILIGQVKGINGGTLTNSVTCHQRLYPYLLYHCHSIPKVRVYEADILDPNTKAKINHGVAICHIDTSVWSPTHEAFLLLGSGPGKIEVCHWIFENDLTWTIID